MRALLQNDAVVEKKDLVRVEAACQSVADGDGGHIFAQTVKIAVQIPFGDRIERRGGFVKDA